MRSFVIIFALTIAVAAAVPASRQLTEALNEILPTISEDATLEQLIEHVDVIAALTSALPAENLTAFLQAVYRHNSVVYTKIFHRIRNNDDGFLSTLLTAVASRLQELPEDRRDNPIIQIIQKGLEALLNNLETTQRRH